MNTEKNILLAEFLEFKHRPDIGKDIYINLEKKEQRRSSNFHFHDDLNLLMEVVEKIESLGYDTEIVYRLDDGGHCFYINDSPVFSSQMGSKKEAVYSACVEFVKWHNQQNPKL